MGKLVECSTERFFNYNYVKNKRVLGFNDTYNKFNEDDTYITIFNLYSTISSDTEYNTAEYNSFKSSPHVKIIWESEMAVNRSPGHGTFPRNKLVVWEFVPTDKDLDGKGN